MCKFYWRFHLSIKQSWTKTATLERFLCYLNGQVPCRFSYSPACNLFQYIYGKYCKVGFFPPSISKIPSNTDSIHVIASSREGILIVAEVFLLLNLLPAFCCFHYSFRINYHIFVCNFFFNFSSFLKKVLEYSLNICILFTFNSYTWFSCERKWVKCNHRFEKIVQVALDRNVLLVRTLFREWLLSIDWFPDTMARQSGSSPSCDADTARWIVCSTYSRAEMTELLEESQNCLTSVKSSVIDFGGICQQRRGGGIKGTDCIVL